MSVMRTFLSALAFIIILCIDTAQSLQFFIRKMPYSPQCQNQWRLQLTKKEAPKGNSLLPTPPANSIGNFFENNTATMSFIQCYMLAVGLVDGGQYGVGFPMDMPVMLTYFEGTELKPVLPDYPNYDHLLDHVGNQLDNNDLQLYRTPVVLTLQGEFEDEAFNQLYIPSSKGEVDEDDYDDGEEEEEEDEEEEVELTLKELLEREKYFSTEDGDDEDCDEDDDDDNYSDEDDEDDEEIKIPKAGGKKGALQMSKEMEFDGSDLVDEEDSGEEFEAEEETLTSFWNSSPLGRVDDSSPDYKIIPGAVSDLSDVPVDAFVTEEDTRGLRRAHRKADRILDYAQDIKLMASFHYRKKNYHLVRLLEPLFIIGRRIEDIKGYYFTLLSDEESERVRPVLEEMITQGLVKKPPGPVGLQDDREEIVVEKPAERRRRGEGGGRREGGRGGKETTVKSIKREEKKEGNKEVVNEEEAAKRPRRGWLKRKAP